VTAPAYLPDPARSRAVLVGVSAYTRMDAIPAAEANVRDLATVLTDPGRWGLPPEHCRVVLDPATAQDILDPIHEAAEAATDALVVYFAGHGVLDRGELALALVGGAADAVHHTIRFDQVRHEVVATARRCRAKVVLLDCCFSGRAMAGFMAPPGPLADHAVIDGTYLMTATAETVLALAPPGSRYTAFTGAMLGALRDGVPGGPDPLDMDALFRHVETELRSRRQPLPQRRSRNDGHRIALVRNPAADQPAEAPVWPAPPDPRRRLGLLAAGAALVLATAGTAVALALDEDTTTPQTQSSASPAPIPGPSSAGPASAGPAPTASAAPSTTSTALPPRQNLTGSFLSLNSTKDGSVSIGMIQVSGGLISYYPVTPATTCTVTDATFGESTVVPQRDGVWIRFVPQRQIFTTADAGDEDFDVPVVFLVEWGRGDPPRSKRPCV
jgi:hypothetical protein